MSESQPLEGAGTKAGQPPSEYDSLTMVGSQLAQLREAKGWSIDDVSARLKVAPAKLRALEAGDVSRLPDTTFALGVVRSYAKMLGVDPTPFAQALRREKGVPEVDLLMSASAGIGLPRGHLSISLASSVRRRSWRWGVAAIAVAAIAAAIWLGGMDSSHWLTRFTGTAESQTPVVPAQARAGTTVMSDTTAASKVSVATKQPAATDTVAASSGPALATRAQPATAPNAASKIFTGVVGASASWVIQPNVAAMFASDAVAPEAVRLPAPSSAKTAAATQATAPPAAAPVRPASAALAASASVQTAGKPSIVEIRVGQDCWFSMRDKQGKVLFAGLVRAGEHKQVAGARPLSVIVGNQAGLESILVDGKPVELEKSASAGSNVLRLALP